MKKNILKITFLSLLLTRASFAAAQAFEGTQGLIEAFRGIIDLLLPLTAAIALLFFFWGMAKFIYNAGSEDGREEGRKTMVWGVIALFCIVTVWGLVTFLAEGLGISFIQFIHWDY